ncbi:MoaD family protein [Thermocladium modestius]|uniref:MoaD family protein n=1 Tax=Thermocladium modestius TaxID=62609 RepID=UPI00166F2FD5|nr:MoaD family protein [Thermocladium modestius]
MRVRVKFLATLFQAAGALVVDLDVEDGATVGDLLEDLRRVKPRVVDLVVNGDSVRMGLVVVVNGRSIDFLEGLRTVLREGDEVALFPSLVLA